MLSSFLHFWNAELPIFVTPSGIVTFSRFSHPKKAVAPIFATPFCITMLVRLLQSLNAESTMLVT